MSGIAAPDTAPHPKGWRVTDGTVPVADVVRSAGVPHAAIDHPVRLGLVEVVKQHGQGNRRYIRVEDGLMLMAAAALALSCGVALVVMVRAIKATGATIGPAGLTFPLAAVA